MPRARERGPRRDVRSTCRSPKQLQELLFDHFGLPKTKKTKTGYTTNAEALADLHAKTSDEGGAGHDFLGFLLTHRDRIKLKQMVDSLSATVASDGRIHTTFSQVARPRVASRLPIRTCRTSPRAVPTVCEFAAPSSLVRDSSRS